MSYRVDGVHYGTWAEYRRAVRQRETRLAREEMVRLLAEAGKLETRIADRRRRLEVPGADLEREMHEMARLQADVRELRRLQERVVTCRERSESRIDQLLRNARLATRDGGDEEAPDAGLEAEGQALVDAARRIAGGIEAADLSARTAGEIVERRQDVADRRSAGALEATLQGVQDDAARLQTMVEGARAELEALGAGLASLDLEDRREEAREQLTEAGRLSRRGQVEAALGLASGAVASVRALARTARARRAELSAARDACADRVARLRRELVEPELEKWFSKEVQAGLSTLDQATRLLAESFLRYRGIEVEGGRLGEMLGRVEEAATRMAASLPVVRDLAVERKARAKELLAQLARIYGPLSRFDQRFADPADRKSPLIVECDFGGARVDLHLGLDGGYGIDGYRHDSNATCARRAESLVEALTGGAVVGERKVESGNRDRPATARRESSGPGWIGIGADPAAPTGGSGP